MKQYSLIYLKDWPELEALRNEYHELRKKYGPDRWPNLFRTKKNAEALKRMDRIQVIFAHTVDTKIRRLIPIGRNRNDYDWNYNTAIQAIIWGQK